MGHEWCHFFWRDSSKPNQLWRDSYKPNHVATSSLFSSFRSLSDGSSFSDERVPAQTKPFRFRQPDDSHIKACCPYELNGTTKTWSPDPYAAQLSTFWLLPAICHQTSIINRFSRFPQLALVFVYFNVI